MQQISEGVDLPRIMTTGTSGVVGAFGQNPFKSANSHTPLAREFLDMVRSMRNESDTSPEQPVAPEVSESASPIASGFLAMLQAASSPLPTSDMTTARRPGVSSYDDEERDQSNSLQRADAPCDEMGNTASDEGQTMCIPGVRPAVSRRVAAEEPEADCVCRLCAEPLEVQVDDQDDWVYTASLRVDSQGAAELLQVPVGCVVHERCCPQTVLKAVDLLHISAPNSSPSRIPKANLGDGGPRVGLTVSLKSAPVNADVSFDACGAGSLESRLHYSRLHDAHRRLEKQRSRIPCGQNGCSHSAQAMLESDDDDEETGFEVQNEGRINAEHSVFCANARGKRRRTELEEEAEAAGTSGMMGILREEDVAPSKSLRSLCQDEDGMLRGEEQVAHPFLDIEISGIIACTEQDVHHEQALHNSETSALSEFQVPRAQATASRQSHMKKEAPEGISESECSVADAQSGFHGSSAYSRAGMYAAHIGYVGPSGQSQAQFGSAYGGPPAGYSFNVGLGYASDPRWFPSPHHAGWSHWVHPAGYAHTAPWPHAFYGQAYGIAPPGPYFQSPAAYQPNKLRSASVRSRSRSVSPQTLRHGNGCSGRSAESDHSTHSRKGRDVEQLCKDAVNAARGSDTCTSSSNASSGSSSRSPSRSPLRDASCWAYPSAIRQRKTRLTRKRRENKQLSKYSRRAAAGAGTRKKNETSQCTNSDDVACEGEERLWWADAEGETEAEEESSRRHHGRDLCDLQPTAEAHRIKRDDTCLESELETAS